MSIAIQVENISKAYQLGQIGTGTISRDLERFLVTKILGKEDPFLKIGQTNDRTIKGGSDIVWSLKDININIQQGEALGIIGRNGAGKSTLLKLLSRVTSPSTGKIKIKGRVASLLEVGTGFHPELSGKENIYLNGAILGMRKSEIKQKFDEIVDFAGVERYIDTPVKRYSSGMYVRLAFAVAAHLESEILIVDEVLAVGDAEFQKKCLSKMGDISKGEGRTVLFVSHNMAAVQNLCSNSMLLSNGLLKKAGNTSEIISEYIYGEQLTSISEELKLLKRSKENQIILEKIVIGQEDQKITSGKDFSFKVFFDDNKLKKVSFGYLIKDQNKVTLLAANTNQYAKVFDVTEDKNSLEIFIKALPLNPGRYSISLFLGDGKRDLDILHDAIYFNVLWDNDIYFAPPKSNWGPLFTETNWKY